MAFGDMQKCFFLTLAILVYQLIEFIFDDDDGGVFGGDGDADVLRC